VAIILSEPWAKRKVVSALIFTPVLPGTLYNITGRGLAW